MFSENGSIKSFINKSLWNFNKGLLYGLRAPNVDSKSLNELFVDISYSDNP